MTELSSVEWIVYGFTITGYLLGFFVVGGVLMFFGFGMIESAGAGSLGSPDMGSLFIGFAVAVGGWLLTVAAFAGALYKIIVDGVSRGMDAHV